MAASSEMTNKLYDCCFGNLSLLSIRQFHIDKVAGAAQKAKIAAFRGKPMPRGPYPYYWPGSGWTEIFFTDYVKAPHYTGRGTNNFELGVEFGGEADVTGADPISIDIFQPQYDAARKVMVLPKERTGHKTITRNQAKDLIRREKFHRALYDKKMQEVLSKVSQDQEKLVTASQQLAAMTGGELSSMAMRPQRTIRQPVRLNDYVDVGTIRHPGTPVKQTSKQGPVDIEASGPVKKKVTHGIKSGPGRKRKAESPKKAQAAADVVPPKKRSAKAKQSKVKKSEAPKKTDDTAVDIEASGPVKKKATHGIKSGPGRKRKAKSQKKAQAAADVVPRKKRSAKAKQSKVKKSAVPKKTDGTAAPASPSGAAATAGRVVKLRFKLEEKQKKQLLQSHENLLEIMTMETKLRDDDRWESANPYGVAKLLLNSLELYDVKKMAKHAIKLLPDEDKRALVARFRQSAIDHVANLRRRAMTDLTKCEETDTVKLGHIPHGPATTPPPTHGPATTPPPTPESEVQEDEAEAHDCEDQQMEAEAQEYDPLDDFAFGKKQLTPPEQIVLPDPEHDKVYDIASTPGIDLLAADGADDESVIDLSGTPGETVDVVTRDETDGPVETVDTFVHKPHFITSARAGSGYAGVSVSEVGRSNPWRVKFDGKTIGRCKTKNEACELYAEAYNYHHNDQSDSSGPRYKGQRDA